MFAVAARIPDGCQRTLLFEFFFEKSGVGQRSQRGGETVGREAIKKAGEWEVSVVLVDESRDCGFGFSELLGREIDGVDDEDELGRGFGGSLSVVKGANLCGLVIVEKSEIAGREI